MSDPRDPRRLDGDAEPELQRMIDALRGDAPSRQGMQRMAQKLERAIESAPVVAASVGPWSLRALVKLGWIMVAAGVLLAALPYVLRQSGERDAAPASRNAPPAASAIEPARHTRELAGAEAAVPAAKPSVAQSSVDSPNAVVQPARASRPRGGRRLHGARGHGATVEGASTATTEPVPAAVAPDTIEQPSAQPETPEPMQQAAVDRAAPASRTELADQPVAAAPRVPSEAAILQRAQRLASAQPDQALRALDEHRRRYPQGMLAPEREVLAIEILHAQGRTSEARTRLAAFRARYPNSIYLERLGRSDAQPR